MKSGGSVTIREAQLGDSAAIADLMGQLGYDTAAADMEKRLRLIIGNPNYATFVATIDHSVCGMIGTVSYPSYEHNDPSGYIIAMVVSQKARGQGIGRSLISAAEKEFARKGIDRIAVNTRMTRAEAHQFYEALGFERNGYRFVRKLA